MLLFLFFSFFFSSRRRHTRCGRDWSSDVCSSDLLRSGEPEFFPQIPNELIEEAIGEDEELQRIVDQLGLRSTICVPLTARGRTLGALTLIAAETHPPYTGADLELALELARRSAV